MIIHFKVVLHNATTLLVFIQVLIGRTLFDLLFHFQKRLRRLILTSWSWLDHNSLSEHILISICFSILGGNLVLLKSSYGLDLLICLFLESFDWNLISIAFLIIQDLLIDRFFGARKRNLLCWLPKLIRLIFLRFNGIKLGLRVLLSCRSFVHIDSLDFIFSHHFCALLRQIIPLKLLALFCFLYSTLRK